MIYDLQVTVYFVKHKQEIYSLKCYKHEHVKQSLTSFCSLQNQTQIHAPTLPLYSMITQDIRTTTIICQTVIPSIQMDGIILKAVITCQQLLHIPVNVDHIIQYGLTV